MQTNNTNEAQEACVDSAASTMLASYINQLRTAANHLSEVSMAFEVQLPMNAQDLVHGLRLSLEDKSKMMARRESLILLPCLRNHQRLNGIVNTLERLSNSLEQISLIENSKQQ